MKKVIITGGCGFIGSNLIHWLLENRKDWQITNLDKLTYAENLENLRDVQDHPNYQFVKGDIRVPDSAASVITSGVDLLLNLAAESHVDRSIMDAGPFIQTNVVGTQVLLDASRA